MLFLRNLATLAILACCFTSAQAQESTFKTITRSAKVNLHNIAQDFDPVLNHLEAPQPGGQGYKAFLQRQKAQITKNREPLNSASYKNEVGAPRIYRNFDANPYNGIPNDNHLAIGNDGTIVSVGNSRMIIYDENGQELLRQDLRGIAEPLNLPGTFYDPRVLYDPDEDRFVLCFLGGRYDSTSNIVFGFSQSNDPTQDWNLYALSGNPLDDESWSDYPMIALTDDEVFFTINLLKNLDRGETWKNGFKQTVIWQIDKTSGYNGDNELKTKLHTGMEWNGTPIRNICPVKGGDGNTGPNMYFLSNRNFSMESDTFYFIEITNTMQTSTANIDLLQTDNAYGLAPDADQSFGVLKLQTNDSRVLDAYLQNNRIVFVSNSVYFENNFAGFYLGVVNDPSGNPAITGQVIGSDSLEFGYPGIAYTGSGTEENDAIIFINHTSENHDPGCGLFFYDGENISDYRYLKEGESFINVITGFSNQRWGDYIGIQRKYNEPHEVWVAGTYGSRRGNIREYATWIGEVGVPYATSREEVPTSKNASLYPNPSSERINVTFEVEREAYANFRVVDINGKTVVSLFNEKVKSGTNAFSIRTADLPAGSYFISITDVVHQEVLVKQAFVVQP